MSLNITKTGILSSINFNEILVEPDGSKWERVFHHNNPSINLFASTDDFTNGCVYKNKDLWFNFQICNQLSTWEFLYCQNLTITSPTVKYRWIQTVNPYNAVYNDVKPDAVTRITTAGYTDGGFGGLRPCSSRTYFGIANDNRDNWYGATGSWTAYSGGIPGYPNTVVTTGCIDIYVRIDSILQNAKIYKDNSIIGANFYEY